ncbi:hypothetical protein Ddye_005798, partial [Dipteronia dyeriana]
IAAMHARGDARNRQGRMCATEHAKHVVRDVTVFHLVPMETRGHALVMRVSEPMEISPNALSIHHSLVRMFLMHVSKY